MSFGSDFSIEYVERAHDFGGLLEVFEPDDEVAGFAPKDSDGAHADGEPTERPAGAGLSITHVLGAADSSTRLVGPAGGDELTQSPWFLKLLNLPSRSEPVRLSS